MVCRHDSRLKALGYAIPISKSLVPKLSKGDLVEEREVITETETDGETTVERERTTETVQPHEPVVEETVTERRVETETPSEDD